MLGHDFTWGTHNVIVLTGANGSGKSSFMRTLALNQILAQCGFGCFARTARVGIVDLIGMRFGTHDSLVGGVSSFEGELHQADIICRKATRPSMLFFDEFAQATEAASGERLCRGLIAWLVRSGCKVVFATHFAGLGHLPDIEAPRMRGCQSEPGIIESSEALRVCQSVGMPARVIQRARDLLQQQNRKPGCFL